MDKQPIRTRLQLEFIAYRLVHGRDPNYFVLGRESWHRWRQGGKNENDPYYFKNIPIYVRASTTADHVGAV